MRRAGCGPKASAHPSGSPSPVVGGCHRSARRDDHDGAAASRRDGRRDHRARRGRSDLCGALPSRNGVTGWHFRWSPSSAASRSRWNSPCWDQLTVTARRRVDADFLEAAATSTRRRGVDRRQAAGASYADLRIHRITTEIVQVRDGELETAVVNREVGLAVRVIVDGTWVSRPTPNWTRRGGRHRPPGGSGGEDAGSAERRTHRAGRRTRLLRRELGVGLPDRPVRRRGRRQDRGAAGYSGRLLGADGVDHVSATLRRQGTDVLRRRSVRRSPSSGCRCSRRWRP